MMQVRHPQASAWTGPRKVRTQEINSRPKFSGHNHPAELQEKQIQQLARSIQQQIGKTAEGKATEQALISAIRQKRPLTLPQGYTIQYGIAYPDGHVESPYPEAKALLQGAIHKDNGSSLAEPTPILLKVASPETDAAFTRTIKEVLRSDKSGFAYTYTSKSGVENHNVIMTDLIENLVSGNQELLSKHVKLEILPQLLGQDRADNPLREKYQVLIPDDPALTQQINRSPAFQNARQKRMGLDLARKMYSENQKLEYSSVILSLIIGGLGEPTVNHFFHDGGTMASIARTTIMSGVDIMGNILSVMGMVSDRLESRELKLSLKTVFGKSGLRDILKNPKMEGAAGPDIKQGIKVGLKGGVLGVLTNIPAATTMSLKDADLLSRSVIGGIGAASSGVAIPFEVKESKESLVHSIKGLIEREVIKLPDNLTPEQEKKYIDRLAFKEMNARLGYASSIKAMNPLPLIGTGTAILGAEKLGVPREYAQTAYMGLAPVMHNFLRLVYSGWEKAVVIPRRLNTMEKLVNASPDKPLSTKQRAELDNAFLSGFDGTLDKWLTSTVPLLASAGVIFGGEFLYFANVWQKSKKNKTQSPDTTPNTPNSNAPSKNQTPVWLNNTSTQAADGTQPNAQLGGNFMQPAFNPVPSGQAFNTPWNLPNPVAPSGFAPQAAPLYSQPLFQTINYPAVRPVAIQPAFYPGMNLMPSILPPQPSQGAV